MAPQDLRGRRIAVPFASTTHYHMIFALQQFRIGVEEVKLTYLKPKEIEAAWSDGRIDATFIWNPLLDRLLRTGTIMINSGRLSRWGKQTFDGLVADKRWAAQNPDFMVDFIKTISDIDTEVKEKPELWSRNSVNVAKITQFLGGTPFSTVKYLRLYSRPSIKNAGDQSMAWWRE